MPQSSLRFRPGILLGCTALIAALPVGVGAARATESNFDLLYHRADVALYQAKAAGKNRYRV